MESVIRGFILVVCIEFVVCNSLLINISYTLKDIKKYLSEQNKMVKNKFL